MNRVVKKGLALLLVVVLAMSLCACSKDPNCGKYVCKSAKVGDITVAANEVYPNGASIDLQTAGACKVVLDGAEYSGSWKSENSNVTITLEGEESKGTVSGNTLTIDIYDVGMTMTFER
ncbi:MAG: hypothetical protein J5718_04625 [Lachnospiraceae bacterium]|nr:hypothetical protein [Lachnospiraceae bacterium]